MAKYPRLEAEEEYKLGILCRDHKNERAATKIINSHLYLVYKTSWLYRNYGIALEDIIGEGFVGLVKAIRSFNPDMGARFATYARMWIKASIRDLIMRSWSMVRVNDTADRKKMFFRLRSIRAGKYALANGRALNDQEIAEIAIDNEVSESCVREIDTRLSMDFSLNTPVAGMDSGGEYIDLLDDNRDSHELVLVDTDLRNVRMRAIQSSMAILSDRERMIISNRYLQDNTMTTLELSDLFCISRQRIDFIEKAAMKKLKDYISENHSELIEG
jgi:RNA polymerase sigma-32 factor